MARGTDIDYYTTGDGAELCIGCARVAFPAKSDEDADENGVSIEQFEGWGGPVFVSDEGPNDRAASCDNCLGIIRDNPAAPDSFELNIAMGNAAMSSADDVADALVKIAQRLRSGETEGKVQDGNGNTAGEWELA